MELEAIKPNLKHLTIMGLAFARARFVEGAQEVINEIRRNGGSSGRIEYALANNTEYANSLNKE